MDKMLGLNMRIGVVSDVHFSYNKDKTIKYFNDILSREDIDMILSAGDWDYIPYTPKELEEKLNGKKLYSVYGNHDDPNVLDFYGILIRDGEILNINGLTICGFGGAVVQDTFSYPETYHEPKYYLQKSLETHEELRRSLTPCDILITHDVPKILLDYEVSNNLEIMDYVDYRWERIVFDTIMTILKPKIYIVGHVHSPSYALMGVDINTTSTEFKRINILKVLFINNNYAIIDTNKEVIEIWSFDGIISTHPIKQ